ncbi:MAG: hypothetical protein B7X40_10130, partial [Cellulomonas sp. 14-74-6]
VVDVQSTVPVVAIDPHEGPTGLPTVDSDNLAGAVRATEHLLELGHRRIGLVAGRPDLESSRLREEGYRQALAAAGIAVDPALVRVGDYRKPTSRGPATELLTMPDRPTAVFAANDLSAISTIEVARELGLSVPEDLSVIGFDDIPESRTTTPPLSTVRQPIQQMGATAIELLIALLDGTPVDSTHVRLPTTLVRRASTAPVPSPVVPATVPATAPAPSAAEVAALS